MHPVRRILNLGCGNDDYGTDRLDVRPGPTVTMVADMEHGLPYDDAVFDEVYSRYSFDHMRNPGHLIDEIKRVLKPLGVVTIIADNAWWWRHILGISPSWFHPGLFGHYFRSTPQDLCNQLDSAGLKTLNSGYSGVTRKLDRLLAHSGLERLAASDVYAVARKYPT